MKFFAAILLLAFVATAYSASLPAVEQSEIKPETEAEPVPSAAAPEQQRDKRGVLVGAYPAAYTYGAYPAYAASYSYPVAYSAPLTYPAYRSYYPSYYSSYVVG